MFSVVPIPSITPVIFGLIIFFRTQKMNKQAKCSLAYLQYNRKSSLCQQKNEHLSKMFIFLSVLQFWRQLFISATY